MTPIDRLEFIAKHVEDLESYCIGSALDRIIEYAESNDVEELEKAIEFLREGVAYRLYKDNQGVCSGRTDEA